jgi:hypothetical protein
MRARSSLELIMGRSSFSSESDCEDEVFESGLPGLVTDEDLGVVLLINSASISKRGAISGYATPGECCVGFRLGGR